MQLRNKTKRRLLLIIPLLAIIIACVGSLDEGEEQPADVICALDKKNLPSIISCEEHVDNIIPNLTIKVKRDKAPKLFSYSYFVIVLVSFLIIFIYILNIENEFRINEHLREVIFRENRGKGYDCVG